MRLGLDLDGVLASFENSVVRVANRLWPGKMSEGYRPSNWGYTDVFSKEDWNMVWEEIKRTSNFWFQADMQGNGVFDLQHFLGLGHKPDIYFITSRVETCGESVLVQSAEWLAMHRLFPNNGHSCVIPVADPKHKATMIQALQLPFFLDDYAVTVEALQSLPDTKTFLLDQPWNRESNAPRVYSVKQYLDIVAGGS